MDRTPSKLTANGPWWTGSTQEETKASWTKATLAPCGDFYPMWVDFVPHRHGLREWLATGSAALLTRWGSSKFERLGTTTLRGQQDEYQGLCHALAHPTVATPRTGSHRDGDTSSLETSPVVVRKEKTPDLNQDTNQGYQM